MGRADELVVDLVEGAIAGAVATWLMGKATTYLYDHEDDAARERENAARDGKSAYGVAAEKVAGFAGRSLSDDGRARAGRWIHWALGVGAGAAYGTLRDRWPAARLGWGLAFGTAFWLLMDEGAVSALGLTPPPQAFPWQTHARGLAGHLVFGGATEAAMRAMTAVV